MEIYLSIAVGMFVLSLTIGFNPPLRRLGRLFSYIAIPAIGIFALWRLAGTDYQMYSDHFNKIANSSENIYEANGGSWEKGFVSLVGLFVFLKLPYNALMVSAICLSLGISIYVAARYISNTPAFTFSYFCLCFLFVPFIRQDLAVAICFLAFHFAIQNQRKLSFITAAAATTVHLSAVLILIAIFAAGEWKHERLFQTSTLKAFAALLLVVIPIGYLVADFAHVDNQIALYAAEGFIQGAVDEQTSAIRNSLKFVFYVAIAGLFTHFYGRQCKASPALSACVAIVFGFSLISIVLSQLTPVFSRLSLYLFPFVALLYGAMYQRRGRRSIACILLSSALMLTHLLFALVPLSEWM